MPSTHRRSTGTGKLRRDSQPGVCRAFAQFGRCSYGDACRFKHEGASGANKENEGNNGTVVSAKFKKNEKKSSLEILDGKAVDFAGLGSSKKAAKIYKSNAFPQMSYGHQCIDLALREWEA